MVAISPEQRRKRTEYMRKWRVANRERHNASARASHLRNKHKHVHEVRERHLQRSYGITQEDYDRMLAQQLGRCAICGTEASGKRAFHVDHCHATDKVRGILCNRCNTNLGVVEVWIAKNKAAILKYLGADFTW